MKNKPKLIWVYSVPLQNYLGERGFFPVKENFSGTAAGYKSSEKIKEVMESFYIREMFYHNGRL